MEKQGAEGGVCPRGQWSLGQIVTRFIQCSELLNTCHVHVSNMHDIIRKLSKRDHPDARGMNIYTPVHIHIYIVYLFIERGQGGRTFKVTQT